MVVKKARKLNLVPQNRSGVWKMNSTRNLTLRNTFGRKYKHFYVKYWHFSTTFSRNMSFFRRKISSLGSQKEPKSWIWSFRTTQNCQKWTLHVIWQLKTCWGGNINTFDIILKKICAKICQFSLIFIDFLWESIQIYDFSKVWFTKSAILQILHVGFW